jgi:hypothetical protein
MSRWCCWLLQSGRRRGRILGPRARGQAWNLSYWAQTAATGTAVCLPKWRSWNPSDAEEGSNDGYPHWEKWTHSLVDYHRLADVYGLPEAQQSYSERSVPTTFTCPYGTFAYRRMSSGLCNAPTSIQRCMMAIFSDLIEKVMEVFIDDFSIYGKTFEDCLANLDKVLKRCQMVDLSQTGRGAISWSEKELSLGIKF